MLAEAAGPDQRAAKKMRPGHCTKKFHPGRPGSPGVTFLGTDTSFAQNHPPLLKKYLIEGKVGGKSYVIAETQQVPQSGPLNQINGINIA